MSDPQTPTVGLYIQGTGTNVGTWGTVLNANASVDDSLAGNVATIGLTNAPVTLSSAPNSGGSWAGPYQSQSAVIRFTGALTGNPTVTFPRPGFWIVENLCTGNFFIQLSSLTPGSSVCAPPGQPCHVYCDGTNVKYVNMPPVGSYLDLATSAVPLWISSCTTPPYLNCDGTVYTASAIYGVGNPTPLLNLLGSTFGGNGITTFGVPDLRARSRISLDGGSGRVTTAGSGIDGTTINSGGGAQNYIIAKTNIPNYNITITYGINVTLSGSVSTSGFGVFVNGVQANTGGNSTTTTTVASGGSGTPLVTMPPTLVSGLTFIKT